MIEQIIRYHNTSRLIVYERLFTNSKDQSSFVNKFETGAPKLSIFTKIHAEGDKKASEKLNTSSESLTESTDCADSNSGYISENEMTISQYYL